MPAGVLDEQVNFKPIEHISPSRYSEFKQCSLKGVWAANGNERLLPAWPSTRLGSIIHSLLEEAASGRFSGAHIQAIDDRWFELIADVERLMRTSWLERHLTPLSESVRDYEVRRISARKRILLLARDNPKQVADARSGVGSKWQESWVQSVDGRVRGIIDRIVWESDGPVLQDYKTGTILDKDANAVESPVNENYVTQLRIYAGLFAQAIGEWPVRLELIPMQGEVVKIDYEKDESLSLIDDAVRVLEHINSLIASTNLQSSDIANQLANPTVSNCRFCPFRPKCQPYRAAREVSIDIDDGPLDLWGELDEIVELKNSTLLLTLLSERDASAKVRVRGIHSDGIRHPALQHIRKGDAIGLFNLRSHGRGRSWSETAMTVVYKLGNS